MTAKIGKKLLLKKDKIKDAIKSLELAELQVLLVVDKKINF